MCWCLFVWHWLTTLHAFVVHESIKNNRCEACGELNWGNTYTWCTVKVMVMLIWHLLTSLHAFGVHRSIKNNRCGACGELNWRKHILDALLICKWCTIFLFSMLYKIPFFCVVQNSCFPCCTKLLFSMMYNIPVWDVVP